MAFCSQLHALARPIWQKQHEHPFPLGIAAGTLAPERFENWLRQDYLYLADYARAYAMAAARSDSLSLMRFFARTASRTLDHEMALHRRFAAKFGIDDDALEREAAWPTTRAYGDFLVRVAAPNHRLRYWQPCCPANGDTSSSPRCSLARRAMQKPSRAMRAIPSGSSFTARPNTKRWSTGSKTSWIGAQKKRAIASSLPPKGSLWRPAATS
jgi:hypothetical protein